MNKVFRSALIASLIVVTYGLMYHGSNVSPTNWAAAIMWLPLYISPLWAIAGASYYSERGKKE